MSFYLVLYLILNRLAGMTIVTRVLLTGPIGHAQLVALTPFQYHYQRS